MDQLNATHHQSREARKLIYIVRLFAAWTPFLILLSLRNTSSIRRRSTSDSLIKIFRYFFANEIGNNPELRELKII